MREINYKEELLNSIAYKLAIDDTGTYCAAVHNADGTIEKRTEWQDGWNACNSDILERTCTIESYLEALPDKVKEYIIADVLQVAVRDKIPSLWINCNDLFYWACADGEDFEISDLDALNKAYEESPKRGDILWVCRQRKMRPQQPYYKYLKEDKRLFDACGDKRDE